MVLAFTGLRWEEAVAVPVGNVDLGGQHMTVDRTAGESGGRRDVREDMKTRAAVRTVMIPDIGTRGSGCDCVKRPLVGLALQSLGPTAPGFQGLTCLCPGGRYWD